MHMKQLLLSSLNIKQLGINICRIKNEKEKKSCLLLLNNDLPLCVDDQSPYGEDLHPEEGVNFLSVICNS